MQTIETIVNSKGIVCYKGKWGWYPCSYEVFLKLKELNKHWQKALRQEATWTRWIRKEPQNRVNRPRIRNDAGQTIGYGSAVPVSEPSYSNIFLTLSESNYLGVPSLIRKTKDILKEYRNVRYPKQDPDDVKPMHMNQTEIDSLISECN